MITQNTFVFFITLGFIGIIVPSCEAQSTEYVPEIELDDLPAWNAPPQLEDSTNSTIEEFEQAFDEADPIVKWSFVLQILNLVALIVIMCGCCACVYKINN
ncbi:hypothetical protein Ddc_12603 [Ditylenchus destructor]|nr:hypothetical protein Ddc_12603 [Ditylenchus destructor]